MSSCPPPHLEYRAPVSPSKLNTRAADLKWKIITKLNNWNPCGLPIVGDVAPKSLREDVNATLRTVTETNKLIQSTATVILEILGYEMENGHKEQYPPRDGGWGSRSKQHRGILVTSWNYRKATAKRVSVHT